jgi:hypothetical protein
VLILTSIIVIIATFKPKPKPTLSTPTKSTGPNDKSTKPKLTKAQLAREIKFDLSLTRFSLVVDILSQTLVTLSPVPSYKLHSSRDGAGLQARATTADTSMARSQTLFVFSSMLSSFGSGLVPATHSLALCILQARALSLPDVDGVDGLIKPDADVEVGKLFGALAVLQAVGQMILGVSVVLLIPGEKAELMLMLLGIADVIWADLQWNSRSVAQDRIYDHRRAACLFVTRHVSGPA